jgi:hypothetical protein
MSFYQSSLRVNSNGQAGERTLNAKERLELPENFFDHYLFRAQKETVPNKIPIRLVRIKVKINIGRALKLRKLIVEPEDLKLKILKSYNCIGESLQ